jgi:competence ComEA-like helix-hairpin-helix protein
MFIFTKQMKRMVYFICSTLMFSFIHYTFYLDSNVILERTQKSTEGIRHILSDRSKQNLHEKISINNAPKEFLVLIPGIGAKTAQKIMIYRNTNTFKKLKELLLIKGIGPKKLEKMKPFISL